MESIETYDAPALLTDKSIIDWLISRGACCVLNIEDICNITGCSKRIIQDARRAGKIKEIDKSTYELKEVASWLHSNPKYLRMSRTSYAINEGTMTHVKAILLKSYRPMIRMWNNDVEDLVSEVCYKISMKKHISATVAESTIIVAAINDIWRKMKVRGDHRKQSLDALIERKEKEQDE